MNTREYIEYLIQQQLNNNQQSPFDTLNGYKRGLNTVNNWGNNLSNAGDYLSGMNNQLANKLGNGMTNIGNSLQNGVSAIKNVPQNVFKGFAQPTNPAIEGALADTLGTIGNAVADTAGSSLASVGSSIGAEGAGATAGATALGGMAMPLIGLGITALQGANRKRAKQSSENLMNQTNQMANAIENDTTNQDFANAIVQQAQNNIAGTMTGGASPITEADISGLSNEMAGQGYTPQQQMLAMQGLNGGNKNIGNLIQKYNISVPQTDEEIAAAKNGLYNQNGVSTFPPQSGQVTENVQANNTDNIKQGLLSKLMSGIGDFAQGYQENRNNAFTPENLNQDRFAETTTTTAPSQQLIDYQNGLRQQGMDENIVNAVAEGKNSGNKDIDEWIKANPEALKPVTNTQTTYTGKEKGKMARLGEGFGTVGRALQKPAVQALLAGGLSTALTGNPLYGLGQAYKFANQRAMNDVYRDVLKQNGINTPDVGMFGNVTSGDMRNIGSLAETHAWHQYLNQNKADELARKIAKDEVDKKYKENKMLVDKQNADSRTTSAQARMINANKPKGGGSRGGSGGGNGGRKTTKPQQHPDWNKDLAGYAQRLDDPRYATKVSQLKAGFINKYGVDPDKFIKD